MSEITITWEKMGSEFTYEVYYAKNEEGPWIRHHNTRLTDGSITADGYSSVNSYTIGGLDSDTIYYVRVLCIDKWHQQWYNYSSDGSAEQAQGKLTSIDVPTGNSSIGMALYVGDDYGFGYGPFGHHQFG